MKENLTNRIDGLASLIGNTPVLAIEYLFRGKKGTIYAKAENLNMTGSIKDRMAFYILKRAIETGRLKPGMPIIEATSGNKVSLLLPWEERLDTRLPYSFRSG